ncbi:MAG: SMC-Scp complex subunit ScpB [Nitrospinaceae bacterium]
MQPDELKAIIENLLLTSDQPVTAERLRQTFMNGTGKEAFQEILLELEKDYAERPLQIIEVAEGFQLCTRPEYSEWVRKFLKLDKTFRLSQPGLDTLSIIAYKQPLTRTEVDEIRGVDSSGVLRTLLERKLIAPGGRKEVPGKPIMYRTTQKFLEYFGLRDLGELPTLADFADEESGLEGESGQTEIPFDETADESAAPAESAATDPAPETDPGA